MTSLRPVDEAFIADLRARGTAPSEATVTSLALCVEAGITYRQCDWWTRTGRLHPIPAKNRRGGRVEIVGAIVIGTPGYSRRYPFSEVKIAALIRRMLAAGFDVQHAHDAARAHLADPDELVDLGPGLALIITDEDDDEPTAAGVR